MIDQNNQAVKELKKVKGPKLDLINYEGPCVQAMAIENNEFVMYDQYKSIIDIVDVKGLCSIYDGARNIVDSEGKSWNVAHENRGAKPGCHKLFEFINKNTTHV